MSDASHLSYSKVLCLTNFRYCAYVSTAQGSTSTSPVRPLGVVVGAVILLLEALALLAAAVTYVVTLLAGQTASIPATLFMVVLLLALAGGLTAVGLQFFQGLRWTRSAAFVWQLLMLTIAVPTLLSGIWLFGLVLLVPPLVLLVLLFTPKVVAYTLRQRGATPVA